MYNYHKTKEGALSFKGESLKYIYGEYDQSIDYIDLLKAIQTNRIKVYVEDKQDHHFSKSDDQFQLLPDKYLFNNKA